MTHYLYPQNLKATADLWLWSLKDFAILCISALVSVLIFSAARLVLPLALTLAFGFLTIRADERTVLDYIRYAARFLISAQQYFEWR